MKPASKKLLITVAVISGLASVISLAGGGGVGAIPMGFLIFAGGVAYLFPTLIATEREHDNITPILILNLLLGWLLIPWIGALVWAFSRNRAAELMQANAVYEPVKPLTEAATRPDRVCPFCAETVKAAAKICKHCRSELPA